MYATIRSSLAAYSLLTGLTTSNESQQTSSPVTPKRHCHPKASNDSFIFGLIIGSEKAYSVGLLNDGPLWSC